MAAIPSASQLEQVLISNNIKTMASGDVGTHVKGYWYAQEAVTQGYFLIEVVVEKATSALTATVKSQPNVQQRTGDFKQIFEGALKNAGLLW